MTSAVHVDGKRLYELARQGITLAQEEIPTRRVTIHALELIDLQGDTARLDIHCSAGTYIRSLAIDLGQSLGLPACLAFLLRTAAGDCKIDAAQTLEELASGPRWMPEDAWLGHLASQALTADEVAEIRFGRRVAARETYDASVRLHAPDGQLVGLATHVAGQLQPALVF
jgi:tRNA pseudouridine55 synthase